MQVKLNQWLAGLPASLSQPPRLKTVAGVAFRDGLQAALVAWRERSPQAPARDWPHSFRARSYPGSRNRSYQVHVPLGFQSRRPRPLVVVLHGCKQDYRDIAAITGFNQLADRHGFVVAYPYVTSYRGLRERNCWGWWFDREIHAGAGEVEDLWQIVEEIKAQYAIDERRIHVTGLSSGGAMAVAMMVAHADKIASGAAVAGLPYAEKADAVRHPFNKEPRNRPIVAITSAMQAEMGDNARAVPIQIVHSKSDEKVDLQSAEILRDSWGWCFDIDTQRAHEVTQGCDGSTAWEYSRYHGDNRKSAIETLFLDGPGHGWYGGNPGEFSFPDAPDIKRCMWKFFESNPLPK